MGISRFELLSALEEIAPLSLAESWDNCGMQIDLRSEEIRKIMVCLELSRAVINEAVDFGADFIITHHPLYFRGIKKIDCGETIGDYTYTLMKNNISVYSSHTCFDKAEHGNNRYLAELIGLHSVKDFGDMEEELIGVYGELEKEKTLKDILFELADTLKISSKELRFIGRPESMIKKIGLCTGSGIEMLEAAERQGCNLFITGDIKHHDAVNAMEKGLCTIDAGHYGTEKIFTENMSRQLKKILGSRVEIAEAQSNRNPFDFL